MLYPTYIWLNQWSCWCWKGSNCIGLNHCLIYTLTEVPSSLRSLRSNCPLGTLWPLTACIPLISLGAYISLLPIDAIGTILPRVAFVALASCIALRTIGSNWSLGSLRSLVTFWTIETWATCGTLQLADTLDLQEKNNGKWRTYNLYCFRRVWMGLTD